MRTKLFIISAPSGTGKTTILSHILDKFNTLTFSISATSRKKREKETDGVHYYFFSPEDFKKRIAADEFLEWEEVYENQYYGTLKSEIERITNNHQIAILDVDVLGGINIKEKYGDEAVSIFIKPPSVEVLRERLLNRGGESEESLDKRISRATFELEQAEKFDYVVENNMLHDAIGQLSDIIQQYIDKNQQHGIS